jgi:hypothetical protein
MAKNCLPKVEAFLAIRSCLLTFEMVSSSLGEQLFSTIFFNLLRVVML